MPKKRPVYHEIVAENNQLSILAIFLVNRRRLKITALF